MGSGSHSGSGGRADARPISEFSARGGGGVWGISDLHLGVGPVSGWGPEALENARRIETGWRELVGPSDLVLVPGDATSARSHREAQGALGWLDRLPGWKALSPGNHDRWFNAPERVRPMLRSSLGVVSGDAMLAGDVIVCGARGAPVPRDWDGDGNEGIPAGLARELEALDRALEAASALRAESRAEGLERPILALWHYPPFDAHGRAGPAVPRFERAGVAAVVYGHVHTSTRWPSLIQGERGGVWYACVAADAIGHRPLRIRF